MDETPIKAGRTGQGSTKIGYFWPVYGQLDEVCFPYFPSRAAAHARTALGLTHAPDAVVQTDGYAAYHSYAQQAGLTHAQCWAHSTPIVERSSSGSPDSSSGKGCCRAIRLLKPSAMCGSDDSAGKCS